MRSNPWPENSDYGKLWRRGYQDGLDDASAKALVAFEKLIALRSQSKPIVEGEEKL